MSIAQALENTHTKMQRTRKAAGVIHLPDFSLSLLLSKHIRHLGLLELRF
jgi:hypothetical protein